MLKRSSLILAVLGVFVGVPVSAHASQPLETETARLLKQGMFKVESTVEYQTSSEGSEVAIPLALEYGITDYLEVLVEPVLYSVISPKVGPGANGQGDLEITLSFLALNERDWLPAFAIAGEVKVPTASSKLIGSGEADYTPFLIASKRFGRWDAHANLGYSILGRPPGVKLDNIITYAAALEWHLEMFDIVAEVIGNTSSSPSQSNNLTPPGEVPDPGEGDMNPAVESALTPEAVGEEVVGLIGGRYYLQPNLFLSAGVSYDNKHAVVIRPGVTWKFSVL